MAAAAAKPCGGEPVIDGPTHGIGEIIFPPDTIIAEGDDVAERRRKFGVMNLILGQELEQTFGGGRCVLTRSMDAFMMLAERRHFDTKMQECYLNLDFTRWKMQLLDIKRDAESKRNMIGTKGWDQLKVALLRLQQKLLARRSRTTAQPSTA